MEVQDKDELTLLMARHDEQKERIKPWHIDSAASNHMTGEEDLFVEMEQSKGNVTFGDESKASKEKRAFYMERSKDEDAVIFVVVVVSKARDEDEEEKMLSKKMRTNGLLIEEVVGDAFNMKEE
nr:retrovirus-related Pol polyprotein from transposon TNT 1-94 [Tanacetum cinerariifolium]